MNRKRDVPILFWVRQDELDAIHGRMAELDILNMSAYLRKMALNGYALNVDLAPVKELTSLLRRCSNNINQIAIGVNTYGAIYPSEIKDLQAGYASLWDQANEILKQLAAVTAL